MNKDTTHNWEGNDVPDELLARWISGDLSPQEEKELEEKIGREAMDHMRKAAEETEKMAPPPFDAGASWDRLAAEMDAEESTEDKSDSRDENNRPKRLRRPRWQIMTLVASVILIAMVYFFGPGKDIIGGTPDMIEVVAEGTSYKSISLPDGSAVELRPGGRLSYPKDGWEGDRQVALSGEAYFKVAKGSTFQVQTKVGSVEVLGTRFTVNSKEANVLQVGCYSGRVRVSNANKKELAVITPGQSMVVKGSDVTMGVVLGGLPSWAAQEFTFDGENLEKVIDLLALEYDVDISCKACQGKRFTGSLNNSDLKASLESVTAPYGMTFLEKNEGKYEIQ